MTENKKHYLLKTFTICLLILIINLFSSCSETSTEHVDQEKNMLLNNKTIEAMMARAEPLIEEITGRKFKSKIDFRIISRKFLQQNIMEKSLNRFEEEEGIIRFIIKIQAIISTLKTSQFYIGRYFRRDRILYVIPENISKARKLYKIEDKDLDDFLFIIIAHEMVHAIDNQYYNIPEIQDRIEDLEETLALNAVMGGSAAYVTSIIADRMNIPESSFKSSLKLDICLEDENDPSENEYYNLYYVKGAEFIRTIIKRKGLLAGYDSAFTSPPVSTQQILFPEEHFN